MSHRHNLCHIAMPRLCSDRYSYSKKRNVYQLDGVLLNFCTRRTGQSVVTPVPTGTRAACSTGDFNTNFDTEQVVPTPDGTAQQSIVYWYYCSISLTAVLVADDVMEVLRTVGTAVAAAPAVFARWLQRTRRSSSALLWPAGDGQPASRMWRAGGTGWRRRRDGRHTVARRRRLAVQERHREGLALGRGTPR